MRSDKIMWGSPNLTTNPLNGISLPLWNLILITKYALPLLFALLHTSNAITALSAESHLHPWPRPPSAPPALPQSRVPDGLSPCRWPSFCWILSSHKARFPVLSLQSPSLILHFYNVPLLSGGNLSESPSFHHLKDQFHLPFHYPPVIHS